MERAVAWFVFGSAACLAAASAYAVYRHLAANEGALLRALGS